jgi:chaperonin GroES
MARLKKKLIVVGDRVLVRPEEGEERTRAGLYLPQTALGTRMAQGGWVVAVGPGMPIPEPADLYEETWQDDTPQARYVPLQAQEGDYALFLRKAAVEITFEKQEYLIVPNSAILVLVREDWHEDGLGKSEHTGAEPDPADDEEPPE